MDEEEKITVGAYTLSTNGHIKLQYGQMWIEREGGEGMSCQIKDFEEHISKFWHDNF